MNAEQPRIGYAQLNLGAASNWSDNPHPLQCCLWSNQCDCFLSSKLAVLGNRPSFVESSGFSHYRFKVVQAHVHMTV